MRIIHPSLGDQEAECQAKLVEEAAGAIKVLISTHKNGLNGRHDDLQGSNQENLKERLAGLLRAIVCVVDSSGLDLPVSAIVEEAMSRSRGADDKQP